MTLSVLDHHNLCDFLQGYYRSKKSRSFSYETWARSLRGLNRSHLRQIALGKRALPENAIKPFVQYFAFGEIEAEHFHELAELTQKIPERRRKRLARRVGARVIYGHSLAVLTPYDDSLSNPLLLRLLVLLSFSDLRRTDSSLSRLLRIEATEVNSLLLRLRDHGLARRNPNGSWSSTKKVFRLPAHLGNEYLIRYHERTLAEAVATLRLEPKENRCFENLLLPLSPEEYQRLLKTLDRFRRGILAAYNPDTFLGKRLYQLNFNISPVSDPAPTKD